MKQQSYDPSFVTERERAEAKAVEDATQVQRDSDPSFDTERDRAEAQAIEDARAAEDEGHAADERAGVVIGTDTAMGTSDASTVGCDTECKDAERAGRKPGETFSAGVWDADMRNHSGQSGLAELERRAGEQEIHPDDIEDEE